MRNITLAIFVLFLLISGASHANAQDVPVLIGQVHSETPASKSLPYGTQLADVSRITISATGGDVYLNGIYLDTDAPSGLSNFTNLWVYDTSNWSLVGVYPNQSEHPNLIPFSTVIIGSSRTKTYMIRATLSDVAAGVVRVGFSGFAYATVAEPTLSGIPVYGNAMTLPGIPVTPTPSVTPSATPSPSATPTPSAFAGLAALGLTEGDTVSATGSDDPDIYIVNSWGYKRLFLNPIIFSFYGHLGGFAGVKNITPETRNALTTSGLFRNCETNDPKVYGVEITGEDAGVLHWVDTSGAQAAQDDPDFFKKVFCINSAEFSWYPKGADYTSVKQVPFYTR